MDELRLAFRRLTMRPAATVASILTLACSIGAAAATWSVFSAVLLNPLPVHEPERLRVVGLQGATAREAGRVETGFVYPFYPHVRDSGIFERVAAQWSTPLALLVSTGDFPVQTRVSFVSHDFFDVLGVPMSSGREFDARDDRRGAPPVAVLTERYWRRAFAGSPEVLGRTITVAGKVVSIVGIAPRRFRGINLAAAPELFLPLHTIADVGSPLTNYFADPAHGSSPTAGITIVARSASDVPPAQVHARLETLGMPPTITRRRPGPTPQFTAIAITTHAIPRAARGGMVQFTRLLATTVGMLLLIGCGSVGMLLLVRTEARREEFAMCLALGASRARLARGIGIEGALLCLGGAALALPIAAWLFGAVRKFQLPGRVDIELLELSVDPSVLAAACAAALAGTLVIALVAGAFGFSADISDALRARAGATPRLARRRTRSVLVASQVAVALVLLAGAGLFGRSLMAALTLNPGFDSARLVTADLSLTQYGYNETTAFTFFQDLVDRLEGNPAIQSHALSVWQGGMTSAGHIVVEGIPRQFPSIVSFIAIDEKYFRTMGLRTITGRDFSEDDSENAPRVTIVSESFGRLLSDGGNPLARRVTMPHSRRGEPPDVMEVVGVVPDIITNVTIDEPLVMYFPLAQHPGGARRALTVRAATDSDVVRREVLAAIRALDRAVMPGPMLTMEERLGEQMNAQRMGAFVLGSLGIIAALLTILGVYVLAESMATLRMREMGIRAALGATRRSLAGLVLAETGQLVGAGVLAGLMLAWLGAGTIRSFLYRVEPLDVLTLGIVSLVIVGLAVLVSLRPALRAARVDLAAVLKAE